MEFTNYTFTRTGMFKVRYLISNEHKPMYLLKLKPFFNNAILSSVPNSTELLRLKYKISLFKEKFKLTENGKTIGSIVSTGKAKNLILHLQGADFDYYITRDNKTSYTVKNNDTEVAKVIQQKKNKAQYIQMAILEDEDHELIIMMISAIIMIQKKKNRK